MSLTASGHDPDNLALWRKLVVMMAVITAAASGNVFPRSAHAVAIAPTIILGWSPGVSRDVPLHAPLTVYFSRVMDRPSVARAWRLTPSMRGSLSWAGTSVTFTPSVPLRPGAYYRLRIDASARAGSGVALAVPFSVAFSTGDALKVQSFTPTGGTTGVPVNGLIAVTFNHPMVSLAGLSAGIQNPPGWNVSIAPHLAGYGNWLGTSTWVFHPWTGLAPSARYAITVSGRARDAWGEPLGGDVRWSFSTIQPEVYSRSPQNGTQFADPRGPVTVTFNQSMGHAATARVFSLSSRGISVPGRISWQGKKLIFHPSVSLDSTAPYNVSVGAAARSSNGRAVLGKAVRWSFRSAPAPQVTGTQPEEGGRAYNSPFEPFGVFGSSAASAGGYGAQLNFNTPMNKLSLDRHLTISPAVSTFDTYFGGPDVNDTFSYGISGQFNPSSSYTITIAAGVHDQFGRPLPGLFTLHFRTARLRPSIALYGMPGAGDGISFSAGRVADAPLQLMNVPTVHFTLIRTTLPAVSSNLCCPPSGTTVRTWKQQMPAVLNKIENVAVKLAAKDGSALPPGIYWLGADTPDTLPGIAPGDNPPGSSEIVVVTNVGITVKTGSNGTLAWVNSGQTSQPVAGLTVKLVDYRGATLETGKTDARGTHLFQQNSSRGPASALVSDSTHFGLAKGYWSPTTSSPSFYQYMSWQNYNSSNGTYLYTDRPVYRPGQTVHFRGVLWRDSDAVYSLLGARRAGVQANDPTGRPLYHGQIALDRYGAIRGSFVTPKKASTGTIYISANIPREIGVGTNFTIAAYRKPEFLTAVNPGRNEYVQGDTLDATIAVKYVFGAPVTHQRVNWTAYAQPQFPQPPGWDAYSFFDWETYWQQTTATQGSNVQPQSVLGKQVARGTGTTDGAGNLVIHAPVNLASDVTDRTVTIEATTTDINHQSISGRTDVAEYKSAVAIGLSAEHEVVAAGQPAKVDIAAVKHDGTPVAGQSITATILKRTYTSALVKVGSGQSSWEAVPHDTLLETQTLRTDAQGKASLNFTAKDGGEYVISVSGRDARGNVSHTAQSIYASAQGATDWGISSNTAVQLKPDKKTYGVDDTAHVLVAAPFDHATVLVTLERGTIRKYWVKHLATNSPTIDLPITLSDLPNVYVTVTLYHGWRGNEPPDWRYGSAELHVRLDPKQLVVRLAQNGYRHHPRGRVTYSVSTTDTHGHPVSAQLSLALVDTSVLALQDETNPDIMKALYSERALGVSTGSDGVLSIDHLQSKPDFLLQPLGGQAKFGAIPAPVAPVTGGGGFGQGPAVTVRARFADTAYWTGALVTNAAGRATIGLTLPDNATTWRLDARGVTASQAVGQAKLTTLATQDLIVRPVLPRFLVENDTLRIGAVVNNNLAHAVNARVSLAASGLRIIGNYSFTARIPGHAERVLTWRASVPGGSSARITVRAIPSTSAVQGDAVRVTLPVHPPLTDETVATAGQVFGSTKQLVLVPRNAVPRPGALTVQISSSLTAGLGAAFATFHPSPEESNEDVADRVLAAGSLRVLPAWITGLTAGTYRHLPLTIAAGVQKLLDNQYPDGGWPWFNAPFAQSDPEITADAVQALHASGQHGSLVIGALTRGRRYLQGELSQVSAGERSYLLRTLAQSGQASRSETERLYHNSIQRSHLDVAALSDLGMALNLAHDPAAGRTLVATLDGRAVVSATGAHWESSAWSYPSGPPIATTTEALDALLALSPSDPFVPAAVRWLMLARQGPAWDCPHDSAQAIAALATFARAAREGKADFQYRVTVDGGVKVSGQYRGANQRTIRNLNVPIAALHRGQPSALVVSRQPQGGTFGPGPLYYVARLRYYLPAAAISPRSAGVSVSRRYLNLQGKPIAGASAGSAVKVELTVHTGATLVYLQLSDPIPAGIEPIDSSLNTSQHGLFRAPQYSYQPFTTGPQDLTDYLTHTDLRDDGVDLYAYYLPSGTYKYSYLAQAAVPGRYDVAPTHVSETFFPEVFGRSAGQSFVVR
jgi:uncharacterized protein YfaS (alpha-2-macroglobulin family)